jgi:hypothetical protein
LHIAFELHGYSKGVNDKLWYQRRRFKTFKFTVGWLVWFGYCFTPTDTEHIRGGWSHYTDISEPVDGNGLKTVD